MAYHDGFFDGDADFEQAALEAAGRDASRRRRKARAAFDAGNLDEAARLCTHGGGYPLDSLAASNASDPRAGQAGVRCDDCGSVLTAWPYEGGTVVHPCDFRPFGGQS